MSVRRSNYLLLDEAITFDGILFAIGQWEGILAGDYL